MRTGAEEYPSSLVYLTHYWAKDVRTYIIYPPETMPSGYHFTLVITTHLMLTSITLFTRNYTNATPKWFIFVQIADCHEK